MSNNSKTLAIVYEKTMAVDCALVALINLFVENTTLIPLIRRDPFKVDENTGVYDIVLFVGTYWNDNLKDIRTHAKSISLFTFGEDVDEDVDEVLSSKDTPIMSVAINFVRDNFNVNNAFIESILNANQKTMEMINIRATFKNVATTEPFFTGIYNYFIGDSVPLKERKPQDFVDSFTKLFKSEVQYNDVLSLGEIVQGSNANIAFERAKNKCKRGTLKGGKTYAAVENTEFVNAGHEYMRKLYDVDVSVSVSLDLNSNSFKYSFKSYTNDISALDLIEEIKKQPGGSGGGSKTQAGGGMYFKVYIPFEDTK